MPDRSIERQRRWRALGRRLGMAAGLILLGALLILGFQSSGSLPRAGGGPGLPQPTLTGSRTVEGLESGLDIRRDERGIPHIEASGEQDAYFGLGFCHAQDRLEQMLWLRRLALGRTAEVLGEPGLPFDRLIRSLDLAGHATTAESLLSPDAAARLAAYTRGVNARLLALSPGADFEGVPEESAWLPRDSIAILKLVNLATGPSIEHGAVLSELVQRLGGVGGRPLMPTGFGVQGVGIPFDAPHVEPSLARASQQRPGAPPLTEVLLTTASLRGRAWVIAGRATASGAPLLATDMHLAPSVPALLYEVQLRAPALLVGGATIPGLPVFWTGRNERVAWALTPARVNTLQLYEETLRSPSGPGALERGLEVKGPRRWQRLGHRQDRIRIRVASADAVREEVLDIYSTEHGPLLPGLGEEPLSIAWTGAVPADSLGPLLELPRSGDAASLIEILRDHHEPPLAVVYADADGAGGVQVAGWMSSHRIATGQLPVPGSQLVFSWRRRVAFDDLPSVRLQQDGAAPEWLIAADAPLLHSYPGQDVEWMWRPGLREAEIASSLEALRKLGPIELRPLAMTQARILDRISRDTRAVIPMLLGPEPGLSAEGAEILALLKRWDGRMHPSSRGAAAYQAFESQLVRRLLGDRIPAPLLERYLALAWLEPGLMVRAAMRKAATSENPAGWADPEILVPAIRESLHRAWIHLTYRHGPNRERWSWGSLHRLEFRPFWPAASGRLFAKAGIPEIAQYGESGGVVGIADFDPNRPFSVRRSTLYRMTADLSLPDRILTSLAPGQSEHPDSEQRTRGVAPWLSASPSLLAMSSFLIEEGRTLRLQLKPASQ